MLGLRFDQQVECKKPPHHSGQRQHFAAQRAGSPDAVFDDQAHAASDFGIGDLDVGLKLAVDGEQFAAVLQQADDLLDEERVAFGLRKDQIDQCGRRRHVELLDQQLGQLGGRQTSQPYVLGQAVARDLLQRAAKRPCGRQFTFAVSAHQQDGLAFQTLGQVAQQGTGRLVGPVQVLEHHHQGPDGCAARQELGHTVQQIAALLVWRQARVGRDVAVLVAQLRHQLGEFGGVLAHAAAHDVGTQQSARLFDLLEQRLVRRRRIGVEAMTACHHEAAEACDALCLLRQPGLANTRLAREKQQHALAALGLVDPIAHERELARAADTGRELALCRLFGLG